MERRQPGFERHGNGEMVLRVQHREPERRGPADQEDRQRAANDRRTTGPADQEERATATATTTEPLTPEERAEVPNLGANAAVTAQTVQAGLANNPRAITALGTVTNDPAYRQMTPAQQGAILERFQQAPNAATAQYVRGMAAFHSSTDRRAGLEAFRNARDPDGGTMTMNGNTYTVRNGALMDPQGVAAGNVRTDGTYQLNGEADRRNYYDEHRTRVQLTEANAQGQQQQTLNLYDADSRGQLRDANVNPQFRTRMTDTIRDMRKEGASMVVTDGFRDYQRQDQLYAQGRTAPGNRVTGARGGQSWHNYGVAADATFHDNNGQPTWTPDGQQDSPLWQRYGAKGAAHGLEWGGNWRNPDRPHHELHPGQGPGDARTHEQTLRNQGLQRVWRDMGLGGQQPAP